MCCPRESKAQFLRTRLVRFGVLPSPSADVPTEPRTRMPHERPGCLFSQVLIWTARIIFFPQSWLRLSFSQIWPSGVEPSIRLGSHIVTLGEGRALRRVFHWQSAELALRWAGPTVSDTFTVRFTSECAKFAYFFSACGGSSFRSSSQAVTHYPFFRVYTDSGLTSLPCFLRAALKRNYCCGYCYCDFYSYLY